MRIIAGEFRGRRLLPPASQVTRPVTDRVKQSVFDILAPRIEGSSVYDCFAGTGSMGLECLSRGAAHATFFESDRESTRRLRANIQALQLGRRATVIPGDLFRWFDQHDGPDANLVFLDPPYRFLQDRPHELRRLAGRLANGHLMPGGIAIFRHDARDELALPPLVCTDRREYGAMAVEFLIAPTPPPAENG